MSTTTESSPAQPTPATAADVEEALRVVVDPELGINVVDLGLVYGVTVEAGRLHAQVTMTSAACPVTDVILGEVEYELERVLPAGTEIDVELVWEPPWSAERMSARGRDFMGW